MSSDAAPLLEVERLTVTLRTAEGPARAVRDLSFRLGRGETLGLVGESGCGKTMAALGIMGMLPENATVEGHVRFQGTELTTLAERRLCRLRGNRLAMIFQEPMTALNPLHRIGRQLAEPLRLHQGLSPGPARERALELLHRVGLNEPRARLEQFPHQLSGGQRQRVLIAMALACGPDLLIADEPTTALDATLQGQILELIAGLVAEQGMSLILISHDLAVVGRVTGRVMVMYGGDAVESGPTETVFQSPRHPYTQGLLAARPTPEHAGREANGRRRRLPTIPGTVPALNELPGGCRFHGRCPIGIDACNEGAPEPRAVGSRHDARCIRLDETRP